MGLSPWWLTSKRVPTLTGSFPLTQVFYTLQLIMYLLNTTGAVDAKSHCRVLPCVG